MQQCRIAIINESYSKTGALVSLIELLWQSVKEKMASPNSVSIITPDHYIVELIQAYYPLNQDKNQFLQNVSNVIKMVNSFNPNYACDMLKRNLPKTKDSSLIIVHGVRDEKSIEFLVEHGFKVYFHSKTIEQRVTECKMRFPTYELGDLEELLTEDTFWEKIPEVIEQLDVTKSDESLAAYIISKAI